MLSLEITYTDEDYTRANRFMLRRLPVTWIGYCYPLLLVSGLGMFLYYSYPTDIKWWFIPALLTLLAWFYLWLIAFQNWNIRRSIRRQLKSNPSAQGPQTYNFSDEGIKLSGGLYNLELKWEAITKAMESKHDFFLYVSKRFAYFLPKTALAGEYRDQLRTILKSKLGERAKLD
jgi:uncharacterized SAM-binding protein YcdF (DUF218 family)